MAPKDLACARRITDLVDESNDDLARPYSLGMMAQAIANGDRGGAGKLLREAFDDLARSSR